MIRPADKKRAQALSNLLVQYDKNQRRLPGISSTAERETWVAQIVESQRRIEFIAAIQRRKIHKDRADPNSSIFDPIRAAILKMRAGESDEAFWLIFLATHFGKHHKDGWRLAKNVYGALGQGFVWTWARVSNDPKAFRTWLNNNRKTFANPAVRGRFSNHRKYESISATSKRGTGATVESYVKWIGPPRTHAQLIRDTHKKVGQNPGVVFEELYGSMSAVMSFGRLAKFDYLTMLGKIGIAPIEPERTFLGESTGPLAGAELLFGSSAKGVSAKTLEGWLIHLGKHLSVGAQVMEDSLCNWQKSPKRFVAFR